MEFSGRGFESHSDQLSIATSKNLSVVNTIYMCVYIYIYIYIIYIYIYINVYTYILYIYFIYIYIYIYINFFCDRNPDFVISYYLVLLSSIVTWIFVQMKLLQTPLKVPFFEKYCPFDKKEPAEGLYRHFFYGFLRHISFR